MASATSAAAATSPSTENFPRWDLTAGSWSAHRQFRWRCIEKVIAGVAVALAGLALLLGDVGLGAITIPRSPWVGGLLSAAGVLYSAAAMVALCSRRKPLVRA